jgi:branched-chain amino acid transport system permease protein
MTAARDAAPAARQWEVQRQTRASRATAVVASILVATAATMPAWADPSWMREFVEIGCYFIFAAMWNLLAGYGGMVSIGQQAFFGFGGYTMLILGNFAGFNPFVAVPVAAAASALIAVPVAQIAFRLQGGYFAIGTWVIAEVFRLSFANVSAVGGGSGTSLIALAGIERATREAVTFWIALAAVAAAIALVYLFLRSRQGLANRRASTCARPSCGCTSSPPAARGSPARCISSATCASRRTPRSA